MSDTGTFMYSKVLYEARLNERQRELTGYQLIKRLRRQRWHSARRGLARGLRRLAVAIEPAHRLRVPAQRRAA